jgi:hypothetical protein
MTEPKIYKITTIAEIEQIPEDKLDHFFADLKTWLGLKEQAKIVNDLLIKMGPGNGLKSPDYITWIDDDKHDVQINIKTVVSKPESRN